MSEIVVLVETGGAIGQVVLALVLAITAALLVFDHAGGSRRAHVTASRSNDRAAA